MNEIIQLGSFGRPLAVYLLAAGIAVATFLLRFILILMVRRYTGLKRESEASHRYAILDRTIRRLVIPSLYVGSIAAILAILQIGDPVEKVANKVITGLVVFFVARLLNSLIGFYVNNYIKSHASEDRQRRMKPFVGFIKALVWLVACLFYLENLGIRTSSVLAGLGIGGIAVALAAQSILGDLFGYFIILFDRPFETGDYIVFDEHSGIVEQIGIKTTKIRALTGEQIVVANSILTGSRIRNFKRMEQRRVVFTLSVAYETKRELLAAIPGIVRDALASQSQAVFDRSHLKGFGPSSLDFENVYHLVTADYDVFMDTQQALLTRILSEFDERGIALAYPTTTVFVKR